MQNSAPAPFRGYLDCNVALGRRVHRDGRQAYVVSEIRSELARIGIPQALVYHSLAKEYEPVTGNMRLLEEIADDRTFVPCWVVQPPGRCGFREPEALLQDMKKYHVSAARIFPKSHIFPLVDEIMGELFGRLSGAGVPVFVDRDELTLESLVEVLRNHSHLNVVLTDIHWRDFTTLRTLMNKFPNLHVELSRLQVNRGIDILCSSGLGRRLIFGSGFPLRNAGAARAYVEYADIDEPAKDDIAFGNLARLIHLDRPPGPPCRPEDPLALAVGTGRRLTDFEVVDAHAHVLHPGGEATASTAMFAGDAEGLLARMDRIGIDHTCFSSWRAMYGDVPAGNQDVLDAVRRYPTRFSGYLVYNPWYQADYDQVIAAAESTPGICGCKPYEPTTRYPLDGAAYESWWSYADSHNLLCLLHLRDENKIDVLDRLAEQYPRVRWIVPHAAMTFAMAQAVVEVARRRPNVLAELTFTDVLANVIEHLVAELGADRVLFGTDTPMRDPAPQLGWLAFTNCTLAERTAILGRNMSRLLSLHRRR